MAAAIYEVTMKVPNNSEKGAPVQPTRIGLMRSVCYASMLAYVRGEPKVWSMVRVPSLAEEDARRLHRERDRLIAERVQHVNRIKGLCAIHGIYRHAPLRPNRLARLEGCAPLRALSCPSG